MARSSVVKAAAKRKPIEPTPAERPLRSLDARQIAEHFVAALAAGDGRSGAHAIHELWMRRAATSTQIEAMLEKLWATADGSIPDWLPMRHIAWLEFAYATAARFRAAKRGRSHIYLVLLDFSAQRGEPHGVYVGMTSHAPAFRFDQHKQGIRAARSVTRHGLELLTGPVMHLQYIARADAVRIEAELAQALAALGLAVEGGH